MSAWVATCRLCGVRYWTRMLLETLCPQCWDKTYPDCPNENTPLSEHKANEGLR